MLVFLSDEFHKKTLSMILSKRNKLFLLLLLFVCIFDVIAVVVAVVQHFSLYECAFNLSLYLIIGSFLELTFISSFLLLIAFQDEPYSIKIYLSIMICSIFLVLTIIWYLLGIIAIIFAKVKCYIISQYVITLLWCVVKLILQPVAITLILFLTEEKKTKVDIIQLKSYTFKDGQLMDGKKRIDYSIDSDDRICAICTETYQKNDSLSKFDECGHHFHNGCIQKWCESNKTCPLCRKIILLS